MPETSGKTIRRKAGSIPPITPEGLARIEAIPEAMIDTSDIPDQTTAVRLARDETGRFPRRSIIREAVAGVVADRGMTTHALWSRAKAYRPTISESDVDEFLNGTRSIGLDDIEALLAATGLEVVPHAHGRTVG